MTGKVKLLKVDAHTAEFLSHLESRGLSFEIVSREQEILDLMQDGLADTNAIVVGSRVQQPAKFAQRARALNKLCAVLILCEPDFYKELKQEIQYSPFLGSEVFLLATTEIERLPTSLLEAVTRVSQRKNYQERLSAIQVVSGELPRSYPQVTQYLNRLLYYAPIGVLTVDSGEIILSLNAHASLILQESERSALGSPLSRFFPEFEHKRLRMLITGDDTSALRAHNTFQIHSSDGDTRIVEMTAAPLDEDSSRIRCMIIVQDVTERQRAEDELADHRDHLEELVQQRTEELQRSHERLRRSERLASIGTLAAGIAHELNNPLGTISLAVYQASQSKNDPEAVGTMLAEIDEYVQRCAQIVKNVLKFSKCESTSKSDFSLNELVESASDFTRDYAREHGVQIRRSLGESLPPVVVNPTEIQQVLVNVLRNAVEACSDHGQVEVLTRPVNGTVEVRVRDNGRGMTEFERTHAFDPFFTTRQQVGGTGLGLSVSHGIVQEHGGSFRIESELGEGTTMVLAFPAPRSFARKGNPT